MINKRELLSRLYFGKRIAEEESQELSTYFVETDHWKRIYSGEIDVIYGMKGTGKSAIYALLQQKSSELRDERTLVIAAEKPRGTPAFQDIVSSPPTSEGEFITLWKLYFLSLIGYQLKDVNDKESRELISFLEDAGLLPKTVTNLKSVIRSAFDYARRLIKAESIEAGLQFDPLTGLPTGLTGKITLREPSSTMTREGFISIDSLLALANEALEKEDLNIWLLIDRLDVAFAESPVLEQNALRALFKVYLDTLDLDRIFLKIFLRTDIWTRITDEGFRESSHITRSLTISWNPQSLMNLVVRRILKSKELTSLYSIDEQEVLSDSNKQVELFYTLFPKQVDTGPKQSTTFDWMLSRTRDGKDEVGTAPRELIHLLSSVKESQLKKLENGGKEPSDRLLFDGTSIKEALYPVSKARLEQTIYAEYPQYKAYLEKLRGAKTDQTIYSLSSIWEVSTEEATKIAAALVDIGFFKKSPKNTFWVPFLYRSFLNMVQGSV